MPVISVTFGGVCQLGEQCFPFCWQWETKPFWTLYSHVSDWCPGVTVGHCASIIYSSSALVIKGCEGAPREQEFVQKECLWKGIYLWFSARGVRTMQLTERRYCSLVLGCLKWKERKKDRTGQTWFKPQVNQGTPHFSQKSLIRNQLFSLFN